MACTTFFTRLNLCSNALKIANFTKYEKMNSLKILKL